MQNRSMHQVLRFPSAWETHRPILTEKRLFGLPKNTGARLSIQGMVLYVQYYYLCFCCSLSNLLYLAQRELELCAEMRRSWSHFHRSSVAGH